MANGTIDLNADRYEQRRPPERGAFPRALPDAHTRSQQKASNLKREDLKGSTHVDFGHDNSAAHELNRPELADIIPATPFEAFQMVRVPRGRFRTGRHPAYSSSTLAHSVGLRYFRFALPAGSLRLSSARRSGVQKSSINEIAQTYKSEHQWIYENGFSNPFARNIT